LPHVRLRRAGAAGLGGGELPGQRRARDQRALDGRARRAGGRPAQPGPLPQRLGVLADRGAQPGAVGREGVLRLPGRGPRGVETVRRHRAGEAGRGEAAAAGRPGRRRRVPRGPAAPAAAAGRLRGRRPSARPAHPPWLRPQLLLHRQLHRSAHRPPRRGDGGLSPGAGPPGRHPSTRGGPASLISPFTAPGNAMARSEDHATVGLAALPDAPVALVRLDDGGRILAVTRAAVDLLDLAGLADGALDCSCVWGLAPADLQGEEGVWVAPGADPARRVCYQHDRDGGGWLLSLPDAETAALWRDRAGPAPVPAPAPAQEDGAARLLARVGDRLAACELELALDADLAAQPQARRLAAGFGNLAEAIRQAVALSLQVASEVPRVVAENDEMVRQSQAQVEALATVEAATRDLLSGLDGIGRDLRAVTEVAASADDSVREATAAARALAA